MADPAVLRKLRWQRVQALEQLGRAVAVVGESLSIINDLDVSIADMDPSWSPRNPRAEILNALRPPTPVPASDSTTSVRNDLKEEG